VGMATAMWVLRDSIVELAVWLAVLIALVAVAAYVFGKVRSGVREGRATTLELLSKFRDVHLQGGLSEAEFRTIKTRLADRAVGESKPKDETG
jgi:hypothetical protein